VATLRGLTLPLALAAASVAGPDAQAAVRVEASTSEVPTGSTSETVRSVDVTSTRRARNDLVVVIGKRAVRVRARSERALPRGNCRSLSREVVRCRGAFDEIDVETGRGDDRVTTRGSSRPWTRVHGGSGADELRTRGSGADFQGGSGDDRLFGGPRRDGLFGGLGSDLLQGGRGHDVLSGDEAREGAEPRRPRRVGNDVIDGGAGHDRADWLERRRGVLVDLRAGFASSRHDRDVVRSVEVVLGGAGRDRLLGNAASNRLDGRGGRDVVDGRGGADELRGGWQRDAIRGRGGTDMIDAGVDLGLWRPWSHRDRFTCGSGRDRVVNLRQNPLARDCERIEEYLDRLVAAQPRPSARRRVEIQVICHSYVRGCRRQVSLEVRGKRIGRSAPADLSPGSRRWLTVRLQRQLPDQGLVDVEVRGFNDEEDPLDENRTERIPYTFRWRLRR
jgi:hypothetical protein